MKLFLKTTRLLCIIIIITVLFSSCQASDNSWEMQLQNWLAEADLNAEENSQELYEKALLEDTLVIYSTTTRLYDVKDSFEAEYPGLTVEIYDTRAYDLVDTLLAAYENNEVLCDLVVCSDDNGSLTSELLPKNIINKYVPYDIAPYLYDDSNSELLYFVKEAEQLFYNSSVYSTPPITNWWELTEEKWRGNVYIKSPLRSHPTYGLFHAILTNPTAMEDAYFEYYGEEITLSENETAGEVFLKRLYANNIKLTTSSNEIVEIIGASNSDNPPVGFMISSKIRRNEIGLNVEAAYDVTPFDGVYSANSISISGGSKNVSCAKLFIRWLLGESDGNGEGLEPYLLEGAWPTRNDVAGVTPIDFYEANFHINNKSEVIESYEYVNAFIETLHSGE